MNNSLINYNPELAKEWHPTKNGELTPDKISYGSDKKVWWIGKCGHEWKTKVNLRNNGSQCPYCSNHKLLVGFNDLNTTSTELSKLLYKKEYGYTCMKSSTKKLLWKCDKCKSLYVRSVNSQSKSKRCPYCSGTKVNSTNSILSNERLINMWNFELNVDILIDEKSKNSTEKVFWKCEKNHAWEATIHSIRVGGGCPYCSNKKLLKGYNDMWTTNPELAKVLANPEDGYKYMQSSAKKVDWKCIECNNIVKNKIINNVKKQGLNCENCSDGISFGEKIILNILKFCKIEFQREKTFNWSNKKRYDFYLPNENTIIEVHGGQHYFRENIFPNTNIQEVMKNDRLKELTATNNGIKEYIVLDYSKTNFEEFKSEILNSKLKYILDMKIINWSEILKLSSSSIKIKVLNLWNDGFTIKEIENETKLGHHVIRKYLHQFHNQNLCDFSKHIQRRD